MGQGLKAVRARRQANSIIMTSICLNKYLKILMQWSYHQDQKSTLNTVMSYNGVIQKFFLRITRPNSPIDTIASVNGYGYKMLYTNLLNHSLTLIPQM